MLVNVKIAIYIIIKYWILKGLVCDNGGGGASALLASLLFMPIYDIVLYTTPETRKMTVNL